MSTYSERPDDTIRSGLLPTIFLSHTQTLQPFTRRHDTQHNDTQQNDIQHNDTQRKGHM